MKVTYIGYFGRTTNVREARLGALSVDAMAQAIAALPARKPVGGNVVSLDTQREQRA